MKIVYSPIVALAIALLAGQACGDIVRQTVDYELPDGTTARGVAFYDDAADGKRPGVLVIPEWWGLTEYPQMRAEELAKMGYVAFVADMYGEGKTTDNPEEAGQLAGKAQEAGLAELAKPALEQLKGMEQVDPEKLAAIGFCFGGSTVVNMAGSDYGSDLKAVVSFHGTLSADSAPQGEYDGPSMLILHGGADPMVQPEDFADFVRVCLEREVPISVTSFPGAVHAFSNPGANEMAEKNPGLKGAIAYDEQAARVSWSIMDTFLSMVLGGEDVEDLDGVLYDRVDGIGDPPQRP